jgi:toxin ParE1/3/4
VKVVWTERAAGSLEAIGAYIAADNPSAATRWLARLVKRAELVAMLPLSGRVVPEIGRDDVREVFVRRYRIVYQV